MNIDRLSLENGSNLFDIEYPIVIIKDKDISRELKGFLGIRFGVEKVFGRILRQFGFTKDDLIVLKNINYNERMDEIEFEYSVNLVNDFNNKIRINYNCCRELVISDNDKKVICECSVTSSKDIGLRIKSIVEKIDNNRVYSREYGYSESRYIIKIGGREFNLYLKKDNDNDYSKLMIIDRDWELEEYFKNMNSSLSIDELYKNIEGYLGDIDSYSEIRLENNIIMGDKNKISDLLVIKNGVCEEIMVTRGNRSICLNNNGEWVHNYQDRFYGVNASGNDDGSVTYTISADNDSILKYFIDIKAENDVDNIVSEVENTKKLVREMLPKKKR